MTERLLLPGWTHVSSGKVRDLYVSDANPDHILVVSSDRISAYDHILQTPIPDKGAILTALSLWWFEQISVSGLGIGHHVVSTEVPAAVAGRAMVCSRLKMVDVECVARGYLAGSGWSEYVADQTACGVALPAGLSEGDRLPEPIFTPATKAAVGDHDENVSFDQVVASHGMQLAEELRSKTLAVYAWAHEVAKARGVILADTKFEFGHNPYTGELVLGDEVLTSDSSRYWPLAEWVPGGSQPSFDKQFVRDWLTSPASGWDRASDAPPPPLPADVVERTRSRYVEAYEKLTGKAFVSPSA